MLRTMRHSFLLRLKPMECRFGLSIRSFSEQIVKVPSLGDSITEGQIVEVTKSVGDSVAIDDVVIILETDKVSVDVTSPFAGKVKSVKVSAGDLVEIGASLMTLEGDESSNVPLNTTETKKENASEPKEVSPHLSFDLEEPESYKPLIQFRYGKNKDAPQSARKQDSLPESPSIPVDSSFVEPPLRYQRRPLSEEEIEAVMVRTGIFNSHCRLEVHRWLR